MAKQPLTPDMGEDSIVRSGQLDHGALGLFTDLYELTMIQGYLETGHDPRVTFSLFFRALPPNRGYVVAAGLAQAIDYLETVSFSDDALAYLADRGFSTTLCEHLETFEFTGDVCAVPEGTPVFPNEPLLEVTAPISQAQLFETLLVNQVGFQSLIATKAARMRDAIEHHGDDQTLVDFGSRRAHGIDAGMKAARAAYVGGFDGTSNVAAGRAFDIDVFGTMAHSWVQSFPGEREAFAAFVEVYGEDSVLLVDTYDTVEGAKTARAVAEEAGVGLAGVRLDSGDLVALSQEVADAVDAAEIFVSSGMDEFGIESFLTEGGIATGFGPGTALVTSKDAPSLDAVYKLVAIEKDGTWEPTMKLSPGKVSYPGRKTVRRVEREGVYERDILGEREERESGDSALLVDVFVDGTLVYEQPSLDEIRERARTEIGKLPDGVRRRRDPAAFPVEVSKRLEETTETLRADLEARYW